MIVQTKKYIATIIIHKCAVTIISSCTHNYVANSARCRLTMLANAAADKLCIPVVLFFNLILSPKNSYLTKVHTKNTSPSILWLTIAVKTSSDNTGISVFKKSLTSCGVRDNKNVALDLMWLSITVLCGQAPSAVHATTFSLHTPV